MNPPRWSERVLRLGVPREFEAEILGDLTEEYHQRYAICPTAARRWFRHEVASAVLSFPGSGLKAWSMMRVAAGAYIFATLWEIGLASPLAMLDASSSLQGADGISWSAFLSLQMAGFAIAAAVAAVALYRRRQGLTMNVILSAGPIALVVAAGPIIFAILRHDPWLALLRLDWIAASVFALTAGAFAGAVLVRLSMVQGQAHPTSREPHS